MLKRTDFAEKRAFGRRPANLKAWIRVAGRPPVQCTLSNLSDGGALIHLDQDLWIPFSFRLTSEDKALDYVCEIRHQNGRRIGVQFVTHGEMYEKSRANARPAGDVESWAGQPIRR